MTSLPLTHHNVNTDSLMQCMYYVILPMAEVLYLCQYLLNRTLNTILLLHVFLYETKQVVLVLEFFNSKFLK